METSSAERRSRVSPSPPPRSADAPSSASSPARQPTSLIGSQDSKTSGSAQISQPPRDRVLQALERMKASEKAAEGRVPEPKAELKVSPPALPPKTRKVKPSGAPPVSEQSDRGDTDMDEETFSSSQEKVKAKKVRSLWL